MNVPLWLWLATAFGLAVQVQKIDLRPGGELIYAMTTCGPSA